MGRRIFWMVLTIVVMVPMFYLSRFWVFKLWGREGLFGIKDIRPQGGLLEVWLRGTPLAPFELLIWLAAVFLILTWLEKAYGVLTKTSK